MYCCGPVIKKRQKIISALKQQQDGFMDCQATRPPPIAQWMLIKVGHTSYEDSDI